MKTEECIPSAKNLIHSLRDIGYSLGTAIADIIDNSITAGANKLSINCHYEEENSFISIADNGNGMSAAELKNAMFIGSADPLAERQPNDLGRFGLGLKTSSFSQALSLTVATRKNGSINARRWDLTKIAQNGKWEVDLLNSNDFPATLVDILNDLKPSGTIVFWENLDRIFRPDGTDIQKEDHFNAKIQELSDHLAMVFHRYLSGETNAKKIEISINNKPIKPFDPFGGKKVCNSFPEEAIGGIRINTYLLPHHATIPESEYIKNAGPGGYMKNQGFYVYRNKRLIIHGTWFKLAPLSEAYKLARVKLDITNSADFDWNIDVKKSWARPPALIRERLKQIIGKITESSHRVYIKRGSTFLEKNIVPLWKELHTADGCSFCFNIDHLFFNDFLETLEDSQKHDFYNLVRSIEATLPYDAIIARMCSEPEKVHSVKIDNAILTEIADQFYVILKKGQRKLEDIRVFLYSIDPFVGNSVFIDNFIKQKAGE